MSACGRGQDGRRTRFVTTSSLERVGSPGVVGGSLGTSGAEADWRASVGPLATLTVALTVIVLEIRGQSGSV